MRVRVIKNVSDHAFKIGAEATCVKLKPEWNPSGGYFIADSVEDIDFDTFYVDGDEDPNWKDNVSLMWAMSTQEYEVIEV